MDRVRLICERVRFEEGHPSVTRTTEIDGLGVVRGKRPILSANDASGNLGNGGYQLPAITPLSLPAGGAESDLQRFLRNWPLDQ